jgi:preprotein translocase subunit SecG
MIVFLVILHTLVGIGLIMAILLHSGRGTGLSSSFGGGVSTALGGTGVVEKNLDRITIALAIIFTITSIILVILLS